MSIKKVVQIGNEILRQKCVPVTSFDGELHRLLDDMKETVRAEQGAGLAAPQIGDNRRVVVCDVEEGFFELVNPTFISQKGVQDGAEGCLSVKGKHGFVKRPNKVKISYYDRFGEQHRLEARDFFARCICHELDHLDGILYVDKAYRVEQDEEE